MQAFSATYFSLEMVMVSISLCDNNRLNGKTYQEDVHPLAPSLGDIFCKPAVWPWDRLIAAMDEGRNGDFEIESFEVL